MTTSLKASVRVLFFAKARELSGLSESTFEVHAGPLSVADLLSLLCQNFGLNAIKDNVILALNEEYCDDSSALLQLKDCDEIAIIPPISGG